MDVIRQVQNRASLTEISEISVSAQNLSKIYRIYERPQDRLKQMLLRGRRMYGREFWALRDTSFEVRRGEKLGIIGRNGSGKSTLLQIIAGTLSPSAGDIQVNGRVAALLELGSGFNPDFTGRENVFMNGAILGMSQSAIAERFDEIAAFADIGSFLEQPVKLYSSGMFMRLAFAVTTSMDPDILLIDEALAVGDVFFRQKCYRRLEDLCNQGVSIILVSHAMSDIEQFCQRTIVLDQGNVLFQGPSSEAVKLYYLLEQRDRAPQGMRAAPAQASEDLFPTDDQNYLWPEPAAVVNAASVTQVSNGWARCTELALCDVSNKACASFQQGDTARFFYEFEVLQDIEVPIGGVEIQNDKGILAHAKNTLQYDSAVPKFLAAGSRVRFRQDIALELDLGEYTFAVGLATVTQDDYERRNSYTQLDLFERTIRICHLPNAGQFTITFKMADTPGQLLHYGVANLPGDCRVMTLPSPKDALQPSELMPSTDQLARDTAASRQPIAPTQIGRQHDTMPTIFHITHWKAGSQWIYKILRECAPERVVEPQVNEIQFLNQPLHSGRVYPTVYVTKQQFDTVRLPANWRRFIIFRDLRDTLISAYFSLKTTHSFVDAFQGNERINLYNSTLEDGLIYLMDGWLTGCAKIQTSWIEAGDHFYRYEDLLTNDLAILEQLLIDDCEFSISRERLREVVLNSRFEMLTGGRARGQEDSAAHERKGIAGDWKNYFTERIKQAFKIRYGGLLVSAGYEQDFNW